MTIEKAPLYFEARLGMLKPVNHVAEEAMRGLRTNRDSARKNGLKRGPNPASALTKTSDRTAHMASKQLPSPDELRQLLDYDPDTGALTWKARESKHFPNPGKIGADAVCRAWNKRYAETPAFKNVNIKGYKQGTINCIKVEAHRVCFAIFYRYWPSEVDHVNGSKGDNRISNLREVSRQQNSCNRSRRVDNKTGVTGVVLRSGKYIARIQVNGREKRLGIFDNLSDAAIARSRAEAEFGYHPNHGRG